MTYEPLAYWTERGRRYVAEFRAEAYVQQEAAIAHQLYGLDFDSVLDVGCGFGRMYWVIDAAHPAYGGRRPEPDLWTYTGVDLSPAMIAEARERLPDAGVELVESSIADFRPTGAWGIERYDLVMAVEVLMHIPPEDVAAAANRLRDLSAQYVLTVDWVPDETEHASAHNFAHDYRALLGEPIHAERIGHQVLYLFESVGVPA